MMFKIKFVSFGKNNLLFIHYLKLLKSVNKKPLKASDTPESPVSFNLNNHHKNLVSQTVRTQNVNMQLLTQSNPTGKINHFEKS